MGGNVADYTVIKDAPFELSTPANRTRIFRFSVPGDTIESQHSILSLMVLAFSSNTRLNVRINGFLVMKDRNFGVSNIDRCVQEVCPKHILNQGRGSRRDTNTISFQVDKRQSDGEAASCVVGDIVLWFQNRT